MFDIKGDKISLNVIPAKDLNGKYKLGVFLESNQDTRVLMMTHDLRTFFDMDKLLGEIMNVCKGLNYPVAPKYSRFELREGQLETFSPSVGRSIRNWSESSTSMLPETEKSMMS